MLEAASHPARTRAQPSAGARGRGAACPLSRADELLELVDLGGAARRRVRRLLARHDASGSASPAALLGDPRILVLDEPANGLDPEGIRWLRDFLRGLAAEGRTVLLSSHVLSEVAQTVDEVVVINHGRLIAHGTLDALSTGAGPRVRVRSPQLERARRRAGRAAASTPATTAPGRARSSPARRRSRSRQLAFDHGVVLHEIAAESSNLEDVFFDLTSPPMEVAA